MGTELEIVRLDIEIRDQVAQQTGFGVPLIAAVHALWSPRVKTFGSLEELTAAPNNVPTSSEVYRAARAVLQQKPGVRKFKIGKLAADPPIAEELGAIAAFDNEWDALVLAEQTDGAILGAAEWIETQKRIMVATTTSADVIDAGATDDIGSQLQALGYKRTALIYHHVPAQHAAAAWAGRVLPKDVGTVTWANKSLTGVEKSTLTTEQRQTLRLRNVNYYVDVKTLGFTRVGVTSGGRYLDIVQGMDWFDARATERIVGLFARNDRVPYTTKGIELLRSQVEAQVLEGIRLNIIDGEQPWAATAPLLTEIDPADKIARTLPRLRFNFVLQGAVHDVGIEGTVLVAL